MTEFSKVAGYKIDTQNIGILLYTKNKLSEREVKNKIPFSIALKTVKCSGINLFKAVKNLYNKNYDIDERN